VIILVPPRYREDFRRIITHRLPLSEGPRAYDMFDKKLDGCIKVLLYPQEDSAMKMTQC